HTQRLVRGDKSVEPEFHRSHVQRRKLRLKTEGGLKPLLDGHRLRTASRDVDDDVGSCRNPRQAVPEKGGVLDRLAVLGLPYVYVHDCRPGPRCVNRALRNLGWRDRQVPGHRRGVNSPGDRTRNDDLALFAHSNAFSRGIAARESLECRAPLSGRGCPPGTAAPLPWRSDRAPPGASDGPWTGRTGGRP